LAAWAPAFFGHGKVCVAKARDDRGATRRNPRPDAIGAAIVTFLIKLKISQFDENARQIHIKFGQKLRLIANDSFKPVC
jgi:hypothetical protein